MSQLISTRVPDNTADRLKRYATRKKRSLNEVAIHVFEEWLRQDEFQDIEFRDTPDGVRRAYMKNSRLSVAWVVRVAKGYDMDIEQVLAHWPDRSREWVQAALNYYEAFTEEIDTERELMASEAALETMRRRFPRMESFPVPGGDSGA